MFWANVPSLFGYKRPNGWARDPRSSNELMRPTREGWLFVRRYGELWSVEREINSSETHEVLGFDLGPTPILHPDYRAAMLLAKNCYPEPPEYPRWLSWVPSRGWHQYQVKIALPSLKRKT
jgi:hypothetical protein